MANQAITPAWYIIRHPWAKWVNVLHWPYLLFHLSYVVIGAALAPSLDIGLLGWTLLGFFLGLGIGAHALDLLAGDPLKLGLPRGQLKAAAILSIAAAIALALAMVFTGRVSPWLLGAAPVGVLMAVGYGLEWPGFHGGWWQFPIFWAVFPFLVSYWAQGLAWTWALLPVGAFCFLTAYAQRVLSTRTRFVRRRVVHLEGLYSQEAAPYISGVRPPGAVAFGPAWVLAPVDQALAVMSFAMPLLAVGLLLL